MVYLTSPRTIYAIHALLFSFSQDADIKSVQEVLGHADASTTVNFYVKAVFPAVFCVHHAGGLSEREPSTPAIRLYISRAP